MKRLVVLSCLFSVGLFARGDAELTADLKRADIQFAECIRARGENKRAECQDERNSLKECMYAEYTERMQRDRQYVNISMSDEYAPEGEYSRAVSNILKQYDECVQARGTNRLSECVRERDRLRANAQKEYFQALHDKGLVHDQSNGTYFYDNSEVNWNNYSDVIVTVFGVGVVMGLCVVVSKLVDALRPR